MSETPGLLGHRDASRTLALGGLTLVVLAMLLGEIYAIYISHVANGEIKHAWAAVTAAAANGDPASVGSQFEVIHDLSEKRGRIMNTHSHTGAFGLLALALVVVQPLLGLSATGKRRLAALLLGGAALHLLSVYLSYYLGAWVLIFSDLGLVMAIGATGGTLYALVRHRREDAPSLRELVNAQLDNRHSRFLLKAGTLLILLGMLLGFYYAWVLVTRDEIQAAQALDSAASGAAAQNFETAHVAIADFKRLQSKIAITAASHSHAIEGGMLAVLLAFVQGFVLLNARWHARWVALLTLGAYAMPVCIYLATLYGLRAAAFADLSGGLMILGLTGMAVGIVRRTGAMDYASP